ncbi:MAG: hypothetical protein AAGA81_17230 [Acidobacteriota bacterium]
MQQTSSLKSALILLVCLSIPAFAIAALVEDPVAVDPTVTLDEVVTIVGCVSQSEESWILTDSQGQAHRLAASEQVASLDGQLAELSGSWADVDGQKIFAATDFKELGDC